MRKNSGMLVTSDWIKTFEKPDATTKEVWPGVWPGVATLVMPGMISLPHLYFVTLFSMPLYTFLHVIEVVLHHLVGLCLGGVVRAHPKFPVFVGTMISAFGNAMPPSANKRRRSSSIIRILPQGKPVLAVWTIGLIGQLS